MFRICVKNGKEGIEMSQLSISFTLGKASEASRANIAHNNRCFLAKNIDPKKSGKNIDYKLQSLEDAYQELFSAAIEEYNAAQKSPCRRIRRRTCHDLGYCDRFPDRIRKIC